MVSYSTIKTAVDYKELELVWNILPFISKAESTFFWRLLETLSKIIKCFSRINCKDHNIMGCEIKSELGFEIFLSYSDITGSDRNWLPAAIFLCLFVHLCLEVFSLVFKSKGKRVMPLLLIPDTSVLWFLCHKGIFTCSYSKVFTAFNLELFNILFDPQNLYRSWLLEYH